MFFYLLTLVTNSVTLINTIKKNEKNMTPKKIILLPRVTNIVTLSKKMK